MFNFRCFEDYDFMDKFIYHPLSFIKMRILLKTPAARYRNNHIEPNEAMVAGRTFCSHAIEAIEVMGSCTPVGLVCRDCILIYD